MVTSKAVPLSPDSPTLGSTPIVFFDGVCGLCNGAVDLLLTLDPQGKIRLAPLQGTTAQALLPPLPDNPQDWSIVYHDPTGAYTQSTAILKIGQQLGGVWAVLAGMGTAVPLELRDGLYRWVARHRYQWLGQRQQCRMPQPHERARFLP